jgi:hypothetical protein
MLLDLLFGRAHTRAFREAIHDNRNAVQASSAAAKRSEKASDEVSRVAQCAIKLLERSREGAQ